MSDDLADERPGAAGLLEQARLEVQVILASGEPNAENDYRGRLLAKALSIAARELERGKRWLDLLAGRLQDLLGRTGERSLQELEARLAAEIRAGQRNGDPDTYAYLLESNVQRCWLVEGDRE